jgi:hypothetical protein
MMFLRTSPGSAENLMEKRHSLLFLDPLYEAKMEMRKKKAILTKKGLPSWAKALEFTQPPMRTLWATTTEILFKPLRFATISP